VPDKDLRLLAHTIARTAKNKDDIPLMCVEDARDILARSGIESLAKVTPSTLARLLRQRGLSARQVRTLRARPPRVSIKTSGPNHVHHFDASVVTQLWFGKSGLVYDQDLKRTAYKNKPKKLRAIASRERQIIRYGVVDAASGSGFIDYFEANGETAADAIDFLIAGWRRKTDPRFEFHGVPKILVADKGSATLKPGSPCFQFVSNLGVRAITHAPGNPAAKGVIEQFLGWWEKRFESRLPLDPPANVAELREFAFDFQIYLQSTRKHSRHGQTRFEAWRRIEQGDLRELPRDEKALKEIVSYAPVTRQCTDQGVVRFGGVEWRCPSSDLCGRDVLVYRDLWAAKEGATRIEVVDAKRPDGERFVCEALVKDAWGYRVDSAEWGRPKRLPDTAQQKEVKAALSTELPEKLRAFGGWAKPADGKEKVAAMPRVGAELAPEKVPVKRLSNAKARDLLRAELDEVGIAELTTEDWFVVDAAWGESVTEAQVKAMAERVVSMRLSGGHEEERTA
jgi:transposase InsO family protein